MPLRLKILLVGSALLHLGIMLLFFFLSEWTFLKIAQLTPAGGVVWLNLNPGGSGSGGAGGVGAPEKSEQQPEKSTPDAPAVPTERRTEKSKDGDLTEKRPILNPPKIKPEKTQPKIAWPGPGVGDTKGEQSGNGNGEGPGEGGGEGAGSGEGKGPGGVGLPGTGGDGSGGEGSKILGIIRAKILRAKRYPREARQQGIEGVCGIVFRINHDGSVAAVNLSASSGSEVLDQEALATVRRAAPFPYYAAPIQFKLRFSLQDR